MNMFEKTASRLGRFSVIIKISFIAALLLLLLIPLSMIQSLVNEREGRRAEAEEEIFSSWGGQQTIAGPILTVPYIEYSRDSKGNRFETMRYAHFLPESLSIDAAADPQTRFRGIYDATVYTAKLAASGTFRKPSFDGWRIPADAILWDSAFVTVELPDLRALQARVDLEWGQRKSPFETAGAAMGAAGERHFQGGEIRAAVHGLRAAGASDTIPFSFALALQGGGFLGFLPLGGETTISLSSPWKSPSFTGSYLPTTRNISEAGFEASWSILSLARIYPQRWLNEDITGADLFGSAFGVNLMTTVDSYMKVSRAAKYGILFLLLPFLTLFLFEVYSVRRIHPLQYLFVGFAECIFYLLLLSLSEHISFWPAYIAASAASAGLITVYTCAIIRSWKRGIMILPVLATAYVFLALVLQSEDYALLVGSLGLFLILAVVMMLTRRIDWYHVGRRWPKQSAAPGEPKPAEGEQGL